MLGWLGRGQRDDLLELFAKLDYLKCKSILPRLPWTNGWQWRWADRILQLAVQKSLVAPRFQITLKTLSVTPESPVRSYSWINCHSSTVRPNCGPGLLTLLDRSSIRGAASVREKSWLVKYVEFAFLKSVVLHRNIR